MSEEKAPSPAPEAPAAPEAAKPAAAAKKEKPPALEEKPFAEFIQQHFLPSLQEALSSKGLTDLSLRFEEAPLPVLGDRCWQIQGQWGQNQRCFVLGFVQNDISAPKVFALAEGEAQPSVIEPFLGDEKKMTLNLLVGGVSQRLNAQKWLQRN